MNQNNQDSEIFASTLASRFMSKMPSFFAQSVLYLMLTIIVAGIIWGTIGSSNVVVSSTGKIIPKGEVKIIKSSRDGTVTEILVKQGSVVKKGDILLKLDTNQKADLKSKIEKIYEDIEYNNKQLQTKDTLVKKYKDEIKRLDSVFKKETSIKNQLLSNARSSQKRILEQYTIFKKLYDNGIKSKIDLLKEEDSLEQANTKIDEISTAIETYKSEHSKKLNDTQYLIINAKLETDQIKTELRENKRQAKLLDLEYAKYKENDVISETYDVIRAPVDATVSQVEVKHIKDLVKSGDTIFELLPLNQPLIAKIKIPNTGIGRVELGQVVKLKYDGYPYQEFGVGNGKLVYVAPNSIQPDVSKQEFIFEAIVDIDQDYVVKNDQNYPLFAGLTLQAEIVVDTKKLISYIFDFFKGG